MEPPRRVNYGDGTVPPDPRRTRQGEDKTLWIIAGLVVLAVALIVLSRVSLGDKTEVAAVEPGTCMDYPSNRDRHVKVTSCDDAHGGQAFLILAVDEASTGRGECQSRWDKSFGAVAELPADIEIKALKQYRFFQNTTVYRGTVLCVVTSSDGLEGSIFDLEFEL